jgi:uncharacterized membrane protein
MTRLLHAIVLGLVGAGIVHIAVLLMVPAYSQRDAWSTLSERSNFYTVTRLDPPGEPLLISSLDPLFEAAACRFDLREGVLRVNTQGTVPYWSMSVYNRNGQNLFSLNDSSSSDRILDFAVATPVQMIALRNELPADFERSVFVEADTTEGIVVIRAFAPDESWEPIVSEFISAIDCTPY